MSSLNFIIPVIVIFVLTTLTYVTQNYLRTPFDTRKSINEFTARDYTTLLPVLILLLIVTGLGLTTNSVFKQPLLIASGLTLVCIGFAWIMYSRSVHIMDLPWSVAAGRVLQYESISLEASELGPFVSGALQDRIHEYPERFVIDVFHVQQDTSFEVVLHWYKMYLYNTGNSLAHMDELEEINQAYQRMIEGTDCEVTCFGTHVPGNDIFSFHLVVGNPKTGNFLIVSDTKTVIEHP